MEGERQKVKSKYDSLTQNLEEDSDAYRVEMKNILNS